MEVTYVCKKCKCSQKKYKVIKDKKICNLCNTCKPVAQFPSNGKASKNGVKKYKNHCKCCRKAINAKTYLKRKAKQAEAKLASEKDSKTTI